jgi:hypothetical protein
MTKRCIQLQLVKKEISKLGGNCISYQPDTIVHTYNPSTLDPEVGGL